MENSEPYRATRLWNEVILSFQSGMPLKRHRRRIQTYNSCFTASDAVTWLHCYLMNNPNFGSDVTRQQSVNLLQKFLKCHVIESVVIRSKKKEFSDDSHLYRFTEISSQISKPSALCLLQSPAFGSRNAKSEPKVSRISTRLQKENLPECHFVERKLSAAEVKLVWQKVTMSRLERLLPSTNFLESLNEKDIDGNVIKHNSTRLSRTGVVCLMDKTDDIPHWVISAMKCLTNWPNASGSGSCLPNYPGFEKDVFKVVRDYFLNTQVPLLPNLLSTLLIKVFCHFTHNEYMDNTCLKTAVNTSKLSTKSSQISTGATIKTSTPLLNSDIAVNNSRRAIHEMSQGKLLLDDPEIMWDYPSTVFYETDFGTSNPVTRVVTPSHSYAGSIESVSTISVCSRQSYTPNFEDLKYTRTPLKAWNSNLYLQDEVKEAVVWHKSPQMKASDSMTSVRSDGVMKHGDVYVCEINDLDTSNLSSKTVTDANVESDSVRCNKQGLYYSASVIYSEDSSSKVGQSLQGSANKSLVREIVYSEELKSAFQLILLILPSANRRQLHLLLRLLSKILKNAKFVLNIKTSMRDYLLDTFLPAIVQCDQNPLLILQIVAFLLDYSEDLFQVPKGLQQEVEDFSRMCFGRIRYTVDDTYSLTYCELVSKQKYEEQRVSVSNEALKSLLMSIVQDRNLSQKERKHKIKQFKESHPDIYHLQFPERQPLKPKQTLLNRLANLRM